jgi:hypothetical protein
MHSNKWLISNILRKEYNVAHLLMSSDGGDVVGALRYGFHTTSTVVGAATSALTAGMDADIGAVAFPSLHGSRLSSTIIGVLEACLNATSGHTSESGNSSVDIGIHTW